MMTHPLYSSDPAICSLLEGKLLSRKASANIFRDMFSKRLPDSDVRTILVLLANRHESTGELLAAWRAIREIENISVRSIPNTLDTCGTGGDGSNSVNLSTLSAVVMAAAGVNVIKHGNRAITSRCGSSDLLASFGMNLNMSPNRVIRATQKIGMGYFHAPNIHPVYLQFQALRRSIKLRTLFNILGPVLNPVVVDYQILGISSPSLLSLYAKLLPEIGRKSALIIQGAMGMDEITTLGLTKGLKLNGLKVKRWSLNPCELGFKRGKMAELQIRSVLHAKSKAIEILKYKKQTTASDSVILSAACGIWISGVALSLQGGVSAARSAIASGKAWRVLNQLIQFSNL